MMRCRAYGAAVAILSLWCVSGQAALVTINFDDGTNGAVVGSFYSSLGVEFSNAQWDGFVSPNEGSVGAGGLKIVGIGPDYQPKVNNPVVATFANPTTSVSIYGLNVGANGARLDAYDAVVGGSLVDFDEAFGTGFGVDNHPLLVSNVLGIRRIELYQPRSVETEGLLFDLLSFDDAGGGAIPEPGTLVAWSFLAVLGCAVGRWRKRRSI